MRFCVIGIDYQEVSTEIRDACIFRDTKQLQCYEELLAIGIHQAVILSTCNRSEWYVLYEHEEQKHAVKQLYGKQTSVEAAAFLFVKEGKEALCYVYEVCLGYHSFVLGEDQIVGQMQKAYQFALDNATTGKEMNKIFQSCFACVKQIKTRFPISGHPTSIVSLAMKQIKRLTSLDQKKILIVGSGDMATLLLCYMKEEAYQDIYLCNRTMEKLEEVTEDHIHVLPFAKRYDVVASCDIVCSATASPHLIFEEAKVPKSQRPQIFLDLALPCDMEEAIGNHPAITLLTMDSLRHQIQEHAQQREGLLQQALPYIQNDVENLYEWLHHHEHETAMQSLQERSYAMAEHTYQVLEHKLQLDAHERYILKKVLHTSFLRMVKEPMQTLKEVKQEDQPAYVRMIETLFKGE